jgi:lipoate---protein ligase
MEETTALASIHFVSHPHLRRSAFHQTIPVPMKNEATALRLAASNISILARSYSSGRPCSHSKHPFKRISSLNLPLQFRKLSTQSLSGLSQINRPEAKNRAFIFRSTSTEPYVNLSLEHYLLQHAHPESRILFLYVNRPCVVIGRNQNPWVECALRKLSRQPVRWQGEAGGPSGHEGNGSRHADGEVLLVRRRSGGGAVFHDDGNLNYSVIVPNHPKAEFKRATHAKMVARAVRNLQMDLNGLSTPPGGLGAAVESQHLLRTSMVDEIDVRVNERNDIVMNDRKKGVLKVSGSAFKLTRRRALHHGTLLFSSPNLKDIGEFLRSPARGFISAKGVESVRSPVGNLFDIPNDEQLRNHVRWRLEMGIAGEFRKMYREEANAEANPLTAGSNVQGREQLEDISSEVDTGSEVGADIMKGIREIMSPEWIFEQTPAFVVSTRPLESEKGFSPPTSATGLPEGANVFLRVKNGIMQEVEVTHSNGEGPPSQEKEQLRSQLRGRKLHEISDWKTIFDGVDPGMNPRSGRLGEWFSEMFPPMSTANLTASESGPTLQRIERERQEADVFERQHASGVIEVEKKGERVVEELRNRNDDQQNQARW